MIELVKCNSKEEWVELIFQYPDSACSISKVDFSDYLCYFHISKLDNEYGKRGSTSSRYDKLYTFAEWKLFHSPILLDDYSNLIVILDNLNIR
tara:strand:- start:1433 stop:1711 length:279 start_codon:yes stop_codon:yes gene_type:complete